MRLMWVATAPPCTFSTWEARTCYGYSTAHPLPFPSSQHWEMWFSLQALDRSEAHFYFVLHSQAGSTIQALKHTWGLRASPASPQFYTCLQCYVNVNDLWFSELKFWCHKINVPIPIPNCRLDTWTTPIGSEEKKIFCLRWRSCQKWPVAGEPTRAARPPPARLHHDQVDQDHHHGDHHPPPHPCRRVCSSQKSFQSLTTKNKHLSRLSLEQNLGEELMSRLCRLSSVAHLLVGENVEQLRSSPAPLCNGDAVPVAEELRGRNSCDSKSHCFPTPSLLLWISSLDDDDDTLCCWGFGGRSVLVLPHVWSIALWLITSCCKRMASISLWITRAMLPCRYLWS